MLSQALASDGKPQSGGDALDWGFFIEKKLAGRIIDQNISRSKKIAQLSPKSLALFTLLIPHFNSHGKMNGEPHYIKGQVCPLINWLSIQEIKKCLVEISKKTNVKWYIHEGLYYLQSLNWKEHQPGLRRLGPDLLPEWSRSGPGVLPPEVEVEFDVEVEVEEEVQKERLVCFEALWDIYPKRNGKKILKKEAFEVFKRFSKEDRDLAVIAVKNYKESMNVQNGIGIRDAVRFLRNDFWREWLEPEKTEEQWGQVK